jgi:sulfide:quinone oxidoreductase
MSLPIQQVAEGLWVSPQLQPGDLAAVAAHGFKTVINNRPDREAPDQPLEAEIQAAAKAAGLVYEYLPVVPGAFTEQQVAAFDKHLSELPGPILAFCRSGNRCSMLWGAVQARRNAQQ